MISSSSSPQIALNLLRRSGFAGRIALLAAGAICFAVTAGCDAELPDSSGSVEVATEQVLRRGNGGDPGSLDPARAEDEHAFNVLADLYEGLVTIDAGGRIIPGVATHWDISDDGLEYTFYLDPAARWTNGERITSDHFVTALRRALSPDLGSSYGFLLQSIENAAAVATGALPVDTLGVAALDEQTLSLRLSRPTPELLPVLTMPIAYPVWPDDDFDTDRFSEPSRFVGNGPFILETWQPAGLIRLRRNTAYRNAGSVSIEVVEYYPTSDPNAEYNRYRAGELDVTATVPTQALATIRRDRSNELHIAPRLGIYYIAFDLSEPPLDNVVLREALTLAIDREQLVAILGRGEQPAYGFVPDGVAGAKAARFDWADLDKAARESRARGLLANVEHGADMRLTLMFDAGDIHETVALAVTSMWRDVLGIDVALDKREWKYFLDSREDRAAWQTMRFAWIGDYNSPTTFLDILVSDNPQNLPGYSSPQYDALVAAASTASNSDERARLWASAERTMLSDYPLAPLYFYVSKHLVAARVRGFETNALDRHPSRFLRLD